MVHSLCFLLVVSAEGANTIDAPVIDNPPATHKPLVLAFTRRIRPNMVINLYIMCVLIFVARRTDFFFLLFSCVKRPYLQETILGVVDQVNIFS